MKFPFLTPVVGTSFNPEAALTVHAGDTLLLEREPDNEFDSRAVSVLNKGLRVGYLPKSLAARLIGSQWSAQVLEVFGKNNLAIRIRVTGQMERSGNLATPENDTIGSTNESHRTIRESTSNSNPKSSDIIELSENLKSNLAIPVKALSGRLLGTFLKIENGRVFILTNDERTVAYPSDLVIYDEIEKMASHG